MDENFYSNMAGSMSDADLSDMSEADPKKLASSIKDLDDMDADLFGDKFTKKTPTRRAPGSGGTPRTPRTVSPSVRGYSKVSSPARAISPTGLPTAKQLEESGSDANVAARLLSPLVSKPSSAPGKFSGLSAASESLKPGMKSTERPRTTPKTKSKYDDFDEDDPLAGLLSDEDLDLSEADDKNKQSKTTESAKPKAISDNKPTSTVPANKPISLVDRPPTRSGSSDSNKSPDGPSENGQDMQSKNMPTTKSTPAKSDVVFSDDEDMLSLGENKPTTPTKAQQSADIGKSARSALDDLLGPKSGSSLLQKSEPRERTFTLDPKYLKGPNDNKSAKDEDFTFGGYMPSAAATTNSRPTSRRSVRFEEDDEDKPDNPQRPVSRGSSQSSAPSRQRSKVNLDWLIDPDMDDSHDTKLLDSVDGTKAKNPNTSQDPEVKEPTTNPKATVNVDEDRTTRDQPSEIVQTKKAEAPKKEDNWLGLSEESETENYDWLIGPSTKDRKDPPRLSQGAEMRQDSDASKGTITRQTKVGDPLSPTVDAPSSIAMDAPQFGGKLDHKSEDIFTVPPRSWENRRRSSHFMNDSVTNQDQNVLSSLQNGHTQSNIAAQQNIHSNSNDTLLNKGFQQFPSNIPTSPSFPSSNISATGNFQSNILSSATPSSAIPSSAITSSAKDSQQLQQQNQELYRLQMLHSQMQQQQEIQEKSEQREQLMMHQQQVQQKEQLQVQQQQLEAMMSRVQQQIHANLISQQTLPSASSNSLISQRPSLVRDPTYSRLTDEMKVRKLEIEIGCGESLIESMRRRYEEEILAIDTSYRNRLKVLEESYKDRENRLKEENNQLTTDHSDKLRKLEQEKADIMTRHNTQIEEMSSARLTEIDKLKEVHRKYVEELKSDHAETMERLRGIKNQELQSVLDANSTTKSMQAVIEQISSSTKNISNLQYKMENWQQMGLDEREIHIRARDEQLTNMQGQLEKQQAEMGEERSRLQQLVASLEKQLMEQTRHMEQERWKVRQDETRIQTMVETHEEDKRRWADTQARTKATLEKSKDDLMEEQRTILSQMYEERRVMAEERSELEVQKKIMREKEQEQTIKYLKVQAEMEAVMKASEQERSRISLKTREMEKDEANFEAEWERMHVARTDLEMDREHLVKLSADVNAKSQQVNDMLETANQRRNEGESNLSSAKQLQAEQTQKMSQIQQNLLELQGKEKLISEERLSLSKEKSDVERMKDKMLCVNCKTPVRDTDPQNFTQYPASRPQPHQPNLGAMDKISASIDADRSVRLWRIRAQKDKLFLKDENVFLEGLKHSPYH